MKHVNLIQFEALICFYFLFSQIDLNIYIYIYVYIYIYILHTKNYNSNRIFCLNICIFIQFHKYIKY